MPKMPRREYASPSLAACSPQNSIASLQLCLLGIFLKILQGNFNLVPTPGVGQNCVCRNLVCDIVGQTDMSISGAVQEPPLGDLVFPDEHGGLSRLQTVARSRLGT